MTWPALLERRGFVWILVAVWALAYLPHLGTRLMRLEEGRRATPAREMLQTGDFVHPTLYGKTYLNKPPLYFWIIAAFGTLLGEVSPLAARLPSVLGALGCAFIALRFAPNVLDRTTRALAALFVLATSTMLDKGTLGEIESTLCLMVGGALKIWWDGNRPTGQTLGSWIAVGILIGLSALHKGPAGPSIFYLTIVPYLLWTKRWKQLFSLGHLIALVLATLPVALWAYALVHRGVMSAGGLFDVWHEQLGLVQATEAVSRPQQQLSRRLLHYAEFPPQVVGMFFPAVLWLPFALRRRWSEAHGISNDIRRFLVCGALVPFLAYYIYPESRARHLMPACFLTAILGAVVAAAMARAPGRWAAHGRRAGIILSFAPAIVALAGVVLAAIVQVDLVPIAIVGLLVGVIWSWCTLIVSRRTASAAGTLTFAVTLAGTSLAIWFIANLVVVPWQAPLSVTNDAIVVAQRIPEGEKIYTTRTFPGKGERFYNFQFHLAKELHAADDFEWLKKQAPCYVVILPPERAILEVGGWTVEEIGRMGGRTDQPEIHLIRLVPPANAKME